MMKRITTSLVALLLAGVVQASTETKVNKPNAAAGETKAALCMSCHTADGSRGASANPILQGQHPQYLIKQFSEFKSGLRKNAVMTGMAATLSDADMLDVAAFYASKKAKLGASKNQVQAKLGEKIYRGGITSKSVPACAGCHSPNGAGMPSQYPRLAGQHSDYLKAQLTAFRQGERTNSAQMSAIAANLSDKEIDALADYMAGMH